MPFASIAGVGVHLVPPDGPPLAGVADFTDVIAEMFSSGAVLAAIPAARLTPDFLRLSSGLAGEVLQKFVNYGLRVAVLGDVSEALAASAPLRDFVRESNRGSQVWFLADLPELEGRLSS